MRLLKNMNNLYRHVTCPSCKGKRFTDDNRLCPQCGGDGCVLKNITPGLDKLIENMALIGAKAEREWHEKI